MPTASSRRRQAPDRVGPLKLYVHDGRTLLGMIAERGKHIPAYTAAGKKLGTYKSRRAAVRAILPIREAAE